MLKLKKPVFANILRFRKSDEPAFLSEYVSTDKMRVFIQLNEEGQQQAVVKNSFYQQALSNNKKKSSISSRLLASIILGAFFVNTVQPVRLARAEVLPEDFKFKAPQSVNIQSEKVENFEGYDNSIKQIIPEQRIENNKQQTENKLLRSAEQTGVPTTINTTLPVAISKLVQSYQQRILLAVGLNKTDRKNTLKNIFTILSSSGESDFFSAANAIIIALSKNGITSFSSRLFKFLFSGLISEIYFSNSS